MSKRKWKILTRWFNLYADPRFSWLGQAWETRKQALHNRGSEAIMTVKLTGKYRLAAKEKRR